MRERMAEGLLADGYCYKYDLTLPFAHLFDIVDEMRKRVGHLATRCVGYGHLGDCNIHLNITSPEHNEELSGLIEPFVYEYTGRLGGSISSEHGLGSTKPPYLVRFEMWKIVEVFWCACLADQILRRRSRAGLEQV